MTDSGEVLDQARRIVARPDGDTAGLWPRAAALLGRRALEGALDDLWASRAPGLERASARAQLACLPEYLGDRGLAEDVTYTWTVLSDACHHHAYETGPTAAELEARLDVVERLIDRLGPPSTGPTGRT